MTVSAIVFGEAPGYCPLTTTVGGTISGYSLIGSSGIATRPATTMMIEITDAKIGRSMKKEEMFMSAQATSAVAASGIGAAPIVHHLRRDLHARAHALQSADHDDVARLQTLAHDAQSVDAAPELDGPVFELVVGAEHEHELLALIGADRAILDQDGIVLAAAEQLHAREQSRA